MEHFTVNGTRLGLWGGKRSLKEKTTDKKSHALLLALSPGLVTLEISGFRFSVDIPPQFCGHA